MLCTRVYHAQGFVPAPGLQVKQRGPFAVRRYERSTWATVCARDTHQEEALWHGVAELIEYIKGDNKKGVLLVCVVCGDQKKTKASLRLLSQFQPSPCPSLPWYWM